MHVVGTGRGGRWCRESGWARMGGQVVSGGLSLGRWGGTGVGVMGRVQVEGFDRGWGDQGSCEGTWELRGEAGGAGGFHRQRWCGGAARAPCACSVVAER